MKPEEKIPMNKCKADETKLAGNDELVEGKHYYYNDHGNWVFTALYHQLRGSCCKSGCTHCPYGFRKY